MNIRHHPLWLFVRKHAAGVVTSITTIAAIVGILAWWQARVRVTLAVRHYAPVRISEGAISAVRLWVADNPSRAYETLDVVWRNTGALPETAVSMLIRIDRDGEILTCDLAEPSLRPQLRLRRDANECEVTLDRIAPGALDSIRVRYRSPLLNWFYRCEFSQMRGDICAAPRPSADLAFPVAVSAEGNGPRIEVTDNRLIIGKPGP